MCCLITALLVLGPRITILFWWLMNARRFSLAFQPPAWPLQLPFPYWVWPLLGLIFLPWTTLAYLVVFPAGVVGLDWLWLGLGLLIDIGSYSSGGYSRSRRS